MGRLEGHLPPRTTREANEIARRRRIKINEHEDHGREVVRLLTGCGIAAHWEYPGMCRIYLRDGRAVNTGLTGWHYGTWEDSDGNPIERDTSDMDPAGLSEDGDPSALVAIAWTEAVLRAERQTPDTPT